jgi:hypothetical protein
MLEAMRKSTPKFINNGDWHIPFVPETKISLPTALKCSVARCARVSYNNHDGTVPLVEKDLQLYDFLLDNKHCFGEGTEVLTVNGFVLFENLKENDYIADVDAKTLEFKYWQKPNFIVNKKYSGIIYEYESIGLIVTEDHTMIGHVLSNNKSRFQFNPRSFRPSDKTSNKSVKETLGESELKLPKSCFYEPNKDDDYILGQLYGFFIGDGFYCGSTPKFRIVKKRKIEYLKNILNILGIDYSEKINGVTTSNNSIVEISFKSHKDLFLECGKGSNNKKIPSVFFDKLNILSGIFDGLKNSDGTVKRKTWNFCTTSEVLKEQMIYLSPIIGISCTEGQKYNNAYKIFVSTKKYHRLNDSRKEKSKVNKFEVKDINVYCASVDNGALVVRTKTGEILVSGNCTPFEHQATPICPEYPETHTLKDGSKWSGNFREWVQYRKYINL